MGCGLAATPLGSIEIKQAVLNKKAIKDNTFFINFKKYKAIIFI